MSQPRRPTDAASPLLVEILQRLVRVETRLIKLMLHAGLTPEGQPAQPPKTASSTKEN